MFGGGRASVPGPPDDNFNGEVMSGQEHMEEDRTDLLRIILYGAFSVAILYILEGLAGAGGVGDGYLWELRADIKKLRTRNFSSAGA